MSDFVDILLKSNTLNFIIVAAVIVFAAIKLNIKEKLENIKNEIKDYVDTSTNEKELAEKELIKAKASVDKLPSDIREIKNDTEKSVKNLELKVQDEIADRKKDIDNNAKRLLNLETKKFQSKLINILSIKSIELAKNNAIEQLKGNNELHNFYINEAIEELDKINL